MEELVDYFINTRADDGEKHCTCTIQYIAETGRTHLRAVDERQSFGSRTDLCVWQRLEREWGSWTNRIRTRPSMTGPPPGAPWRVAWDDQRLMSE